MTKAQSDIISTVIIVIIALGLMSSAYIWGFPLIQKRQDTAVVDRTDTYFDQTNVNSLPNVIESVANSGGQRTFSMDTSGIWILNPDQNYIEFTFLSKVSRFAVDTQYPISLTPGAQCAPQPSNGTLGLDKSSVICVRASTVGDRINITYRIWFRELYENPYLTTGKGYKIDLVKDDAGVLSSTKKEVTISFFNTGQQIVNGKTLITKEIKILLI